MTENSKAPKDEDQATQATQQQTRPPNPHNNKPGRPNPTNKNKIKISNNSKTNKKTISQFWARNSKINHLSRRTVPYDLPGGIFVVNNSHIANTSFFFIYAPPSYYS